MDPYPETAQGYRFIFTITDLFSRWVEGYPLKSTTTKELVKILEDEVFTRFGYPRAIITDNGSQFTGHGWRRVCRHGQTLHWTTAPYTPRQNPMERRNQEIKKAIRIHLQGGEPTHWDQALPTALFQIRRLRNAATGTSPSKLLYGRDLPFPGEWDTPQGEAAIEPAGQREEEARERQRLRARGPGVGTRPGRRPTLQTEVERPSHYHQTCGKLTHV